MSKILKRPMFRKGGEAGGGIMSGINTRSNYQEAGTVYDKTKFAGNPEVLSNMEMATELFRPLYQEMAPTKDEILAKLLISGGLAGMSSTGGGSTLANIAKAFQKPAEEAIGEYYQGKRMGKQAEAKGAEYALGLELQKAKASNKELFREQLVESQANQILDSVKNNPFVATAYVKNYNKLKQAIKAGVDIDVLTDADVDKKTSKIKPDYYRNKDNTIYINPFTNRFEKIKNGIPVQIDQKTFQEVKINE